MAFHTKRGVSHTNVIVLTLKMTIKYQIHAIPTTLQGTTTLHYKKFKQILPSNSLRRTWTFLISNYSRSNFASSLMKLDFDKASKEMNKETNPIGRVCNEAVEGGYYGGL
jgi:hypothetical protein